MITILVNGTPFGGNASSVRTMGDIVELVKTTIDPDTVITSIQYEGRELSDGDWRAPITPHQTETISIFTGSRAGYVADRLEAAPAYVDRIMDGFKQVKLNFRSGSQVAGNQDLSKVVQDLHAYIDWYHAILEMLPERFQPERDNFIAEVRSLTDVCEQLLQQQLYRAWWALHETIERRLMPSLEKLKGVALATYKATEN